MAPSMQPTEFSTMKPLIGLSVILLAAFGLSQAIGRNSPDRPAGIAANQWAPISETLGVVLIPEAGRTAPERPTPHLDVDPTGLYVAPSPAVVAVIEEGHPVRGYLMVKRGKFWRPLVVVAPSTPG